MEPLGTQVQNAFNNFIQGKYQEALEALNRFKQHKESDADQPMIQINENIVLCEYVLNKHSNSQHVLQKLDELTEEAKRRRGENQKKHRSKQENEESPSSIWDDTVIRFNKVVILLQNGKVFQAHQALKQLLGDCKILGMRLRCELLLFETSFLTEDFEMADMFYRKYLSEEDELPKLPLGQQDLDNQFQDSGELKQSSKYQSYIHPLILGSEINSYNEAPSIFNKFEYQVMQLFMRVRLCLQAGDSDCGDKIQSLEARVKAFQDFTNNSIHLYKPELQAWIKTHINFAFKVLKAHHTFRLEENQSDALRALTSLQTDDEKKLAQYSAVQFNNIGCVQIKLKKYGLAAYYFQKAIQIIQKHQVNPENKYEFIVHTNLKSKLNLIFQNLADALFQDGKYKQADKIYEQLQEFSAYKARFWYNRGVCMINLYHEYLKEKTKYEFYDVMDDCSPKFTFERQRKGHNYDHDGDEDGATRRLILQQKEVHSDLDEEVIQDISQPSFSYNQKQQQKYDCALFQQDKQAKEFLSQAQKYFRNCLMILKKAKNKPDVYLNEHQKSKKDSQLIIKQKDQKLALYESAQVYLAYSLLSRGDFNQALQISKETIETCVNEENKFILLQYILEAYLESNRLKEAYSYIQSSSIQSFISKQINPSQSSSMSRNVLGIRTAQIKQFQNKGIFYFNLSVLHLHNNNTAVAQNSINQMLTAFDININSPQAQIPIPVLNLLIWQNLKTDNLPYAIQLLRRRRILNGPIGKNKISLLRITK